jgi:hypothetical protein
MLLFMEHLQGADSVCGGALQGQGVGETNKHELLFEIQPYSAYAPTLKGAARVSHSISVR